MNRMPQCSSAGNILSRRTFLLRCFFKKKVGVGKFFKENIYAQIYTVCHLTNNDNNSNNNNNKMMKIIISGKKLKDDGIQMAGGIAIEDLGEGAYKYLGVLESDKIKMEEIRYNSAKNTIAGQGKCWNQV